MTEISQSQATELARRLENIAAMHLSQLDSLELLDLHTASNILQAKVEIEASLTWEEQRAIDEHDDLVRDLEEIGSLLGSRYMDADDIIDEIIAMQDKIKKFEAA